MQDDLTDAVQFLTGAGLTDPSRVCIVGGSYGGYAALAGAAFTPDLYRCAVSINGVSDISGLLQADRRRFGKNHWVLSYMERTIGKDDFNREFMDSISPAKFASRVKTPVLLIHGEHDETVPIEQSETMYKQLKRAGKPVEFIELKGENHYLMQGATRLQALEHILEFVDKNLKPL
jgi:dipeptidyl aminopeptidase/acylaminoacyl peptidase